jgi:hypothetical protein
MYKCILRCFSLSCGLRLSWSYLQVYHVSRESFLYLKVCLLSAEVT